MTRGSLLRKTREFHLVRPVRSVSRVTVPLRSSSGRGPAMTPSSDMKSTEAAHKGSGSSLASFGSLPVTNVTLASIAMGTAFLVSASIRSLLWVRMASQVQGVCRWNRGLLLMEESVGRSKSKTILILGSKLLQTTWKNAQKCSTLLRVSISIKRVFYLASIFSSTLGIFLKSSISIPRIPPL